MGKTVKETIPDDLSIHPRHWRGVRGFGAGTHNTKRDTSRPKKGAARKLDRKSAWLAARRTDHAATIRGTKHAAAYRTPGSMNDGK